MTVLARPKPLRLDHGLTADLRAGRLDADALDALAAALDLAIDKPTEAASALGIERSREELAAVSTLQDEVLREAAGTLPSVLSVVAKANLIHSAFQRYRAGAWRRDRVLDECPARHHGTLKEFGWRWLRLRDNVPSGRTIRRKLGQRPM